MPIRVALAAWLLTATPCLAAEWRPVVVASFAGWNELDADLTFLGQLVQVPDLSQTLGKRLSDRTEVKDLAGLDGRRPWGAVVQTDGLRFSSAAFLPVSDAAALLKALAPLVGEPQPVAPDVWKIGRQTFTGFVRHHEGWLYVGQTREDLENLPDPQTVLGDLPTRYDLAVTFYPAHLPEALRTLAIDQVREERQLRLDVLPPNQAADLVASPALASLIYEAVEEFFSDVRQVTLGCTLDRQRQTAALDVSIHPIAGSRVARRWESQRAANSKVRSGGPTGSTWLDFGVTVQRENTNAGGLSTEYSALSTQYVGALLTRAARFTPLQRQVALSCVEALNALLAGITAGDRTDLAIRTHGTNPPYLLLVAARLNEPDVVQRALNALAEAAHVDGSFLRVKLDVARRGSLRVHALELLGVDGLDPLAKLFGGDPTLYVATTGQHLLLACGDRSMTALENWRPSAEQQTRAVEVSARLGAVLTALAQGKSNQDNAALLTLLALPLQADDDRLSFSINNEKEGLEARLVLREGILRLLALGLNFRAQRSQQSRDRASIPPARTP